MRVRRLSTRRFPGFIAVSAAFLVALAALAGTAEAAPGDLDASFGDGGYAFTNLAEDASGGAVEAVAVQADGHIVVAGTGHNDNTYSLYDDSSYFAVARYEADGGLDPSFGNGGRVYAPLPYAGFMAAVAIQPDGKIVVAGQSNGLAIVRYESDGGLDPSFGDGGVFLENGTTFAVADAKLLSDGKILALGQSSLGVRLLRVNTNGTLDAGFGSGGIVELGISGAGINAMAVAPDGGILLAGILSSQCLVVRLEADGSPDLSFDGDGRVTTAVVGGDCEAYAVALQADGNILVAGFMRVGTGPRNVAVLRHDDSGPLDPSFDGDGIATVSSGTDSTAGLSLLVQPDGHIVVPVQGVDSFQQFGVLRFDTDGSLDSTFDGDGVVTTDVPVEWEVPTAALLQVDGRIVVAGTSYYYDYPNRFVVVRYDSDGTLDGGFDGDGIVTTRMGTSYDRVSSLAVRPDGRIVASGSLTREVGSQFPVEIGLAAYESDGTPDFGFDTDGKSWLPLPGDGGWYGAAGPSALQPDGRLVVAAAPGGFSFNYPTSWVLSRWNEDGSLDAGFGDAGLVTLAMSDTQTEPRAVVMQDDGKIVIAGVAYVDFVAHFALVRLESDGDLDPTFDGDGIAITDVGSEHAEARALLVQPDGRIVAAGMSIFRGFDAFAVVRYLPDGSLDTSFSVDGKLTTSIFQSAYEQAESIAIQEDGKLVAIGSTLGNYENHVAALVRYNPNGLLDSTFGQQGKVTLLVGGYTSGRAVAIQADGRIVATTSNAIARFLPDGSLDAGFGSDGLVLTTPEGYYSSETSALLIQPDGRILVGGYGDSSTGPDFAIARYEGTDCGDGSIDAGENCDDGNLVSGDGCSAGCRLDPCGASPSLSCKTPLSGRRAKVQLKDNADDVRDVLTWRWSDGPMTDVSELGDPLTTDDYWLCVYDAGQLVSSTLVPFGGTCGSKPCWSAATDKFSLRSGTGLPEGATQLTLLAGDDGATSAGLRTRGVAFEMPAPDSIAGPLVVQLARGDGGICLSSTFSPPFAKQDSLKLSARSD